VISEYYQDVDGPAGVVGVLLLLDGDNPQVGRRVLVIHGKVRNPLQVEPWPCLIFVRNPTNHCFYCNHGSIIQDFS